MITLVEKDLIKKQERFVKCHLSKSLLVGFVKPFPQTPSQPKQSGSKFFLFNFNDEQELNFFPTIVGLSNEKKMKTFDVNIQFQFCQKHWNSNHLI